MKAVPSWDMSNNVSESSIFFKLRELFLKPLQLKSWISSVIKKPPVKIVTSLHVDTNHLTFRVELKWLGVVSPFTEDFNFFLTQPSFVCPALLKMVDGPVAVDL